jgi:hypothetical protein
MDEALKAMATSSPPFYSSLKIFQYIGIVQNLAELRVATNFWNQLDAVLTYMKPWNIWQN